MNDESSPFNKIATTLFDISHLSHAGLRGHKTAASEETRDRCLRRAGQLLLWQCCDNLREASETFLEAKQVPLSEARRIYGDVLGDISAATVGMTVSFRDVINLNDPKHIKVLPHTAMTIHKILSELISLSESAQYKRDNKIRYFFENETLRKYVLEFVKYLNDSKLAEKLQEVKSEKHFQGKTLADYGRETRNMMRQLTQLINHQRRTDVLTDEPEVEELVSRVAGWDCCLKMMDWIWAPSQHLVKE